MLQGDVSTDVLVVGGGITGVTLALLLAEKGRSVVLLEADTIGSGSTGNSTGNLYKTLSQGLHGITTRWGDEVASQAVAQREVSAPLPRPAGSVLVLDSQAQIQPQAYVNHLARRAAGAGAHVHEHSRAIELDHKAMRAATAMGSVNAQEIVLATHSPKGFHIVQAEMPVHREYGIARRWTAPTPGRASSGTGATSATRSAPWMRAASVTWYASARSRGPACTTPRPA